MSWSKGDEISASKLNSENYTPSWSYYWTNEGKGQEKRTKFSYTFYYHDGGGTNNPNIMSWNIIARPSTSWGNKFGPDMYIDYEKRTASGDRIGSSVQVCRFWNKDANINGSLSRTSAISKFGSAEGWYYISLEFLSNQIGTGTCNYYVYGYPTNNKKGRPLRYYDNPTSSGYAAAGTELSATNLNTHRVGTY